MKVAIVHEMLVKLGGAERVVKKLSDMFPDAPIYTLVHNEVKTVDWFAGKKIITSPLQKLYTLTGKYRMLLPWMGEAVESWNFDEYDLVISSSSAFTHGIKTNGETKHLCYCHSPMRYGWDYTHKYMENKGLISRFLAALTLHKARMWDMENAKRPDAIVANSKHVQKRIQKYWRQESTVIYPPVSLRRFKVSQKNEDYFLILSALTPFKKIDLAINAFNQNGHRLVIIGYGPEYFRLKAMAKENIELLGYKPDDVVRVYMEHCRALIFPGEEDFGITPIEAMANGKPVLAYGKGGCTESVKPGINGELFIKPSTKSLNQGLERLIKNEKGYDPEKIRSSVERFNESEFEESVRIEIDHLMRRGA